MFLYILVTVFYQASFTNFPLVSSLFFWHCLLQTRSFSFSLSPVYQVSFSWISSLVLYLESHWHTQGNVDFLLLFSRSFIVLHFILRSMVHFELVFVKGIRSVSRSILLHVRVRLLCHHLLIKTVFSYCIALAPLSKINWLCLCGSVLGHKFFIPLISMSASPIIAQCLDYCNLVLDFYSVSPVTLFFNTLLSILDLLPLHIKCRISLLMTTKRDFDWHCSWEELTSWQYTLFQLKCRSV